jgi:hypothetical protein
LLLFGCFLAFSVRKVASEYNESRYIMFAVRHENTQKLKTKEKFQFLLTNFLVQLYNILVVTVVSFVLLFLVNLNPYGSFYLQTSIVIFVTTTVWIPLWVPKMYFIATGKESWSSSMILFFLLRKFPTNTKKKNQLDLFCVLFLILFAGKSGSGGTKTQQSGTTMERHEGKKSSRQSDLTKPKKEDLI